MTRWTESTFLKFHDSVKFSGVFQGKFDWLLPVSNLMICFGKKINFCCQKNQPVSLVSNRTDCLDQKTVGSLAKSRDAFRLAYSTKPELGLKQQPGH
jgi:hypothetical protein